MAASAATMAALLAFGLAAGAGAQPYPPPPPYGRPPPPPYAVPPPPPNAPTGAGTSLLGFHVGAAIPLNDVDVGAIDFTSTGGGRGGRDTNGDPGPMIGLDYLYQVGAHLGFGGEVDYLHRSASRSLSLVPLAETNVSGNTWLFLGDVKYSFRPGRRVRPYLLAAAGAHRTSTTIDATPLPGFSWGDTGTDETREIVDDHLWGLATSLRFGIDFSQAAPTVLGFELGWTRLDTARYRATPNGQALGLDAVSGAIHFLTLTGHLKFGFGGAS